MRKLLIATALSLMAVCSAWGQKTVTVTVPRNNMYTAIGIYNPQGVMVHTLGKTVRNAGTYVYNWSGYNYQDSLNAVLDGDAGTNPTIIANQTGYYAMQLSKPRFQAERLLEYGSSLPQSTQYWQYLGAHHGPRAILVDNSEAGGPYLYIGMGSSENMANAWKGNLDATVTYTSTVSNPGGGTSSYIGWYWQPKPQRGRWNYFMSGDTVFFMQQDQYVFGHDRRRVNSRSQSISSANNPDNFLTTSFRWDALYPGFTRLGADSWQQPGKQNVYLHGRKVGAHGMCALSWRDQDAIVFRYASNGVIRRTVTTGLTRPKGLFMLDDGDVLVADTNTVKRVDFATGSVSTVIPAGRGLTQAQYVIQDEGTGDIYVYDEGTKRVMRFNSSGFRERTYGKSGGRDYGIYRPENFTDVTGFTPDLSGGFFIAEDGPVKRVARFDSTGKLVKEIFTGTYWVPSVTVEPSSLNGDGAAAWMQMDKRHLVRYLLDFKTGSWRVHSTYNFENLGGGLIDVNGIGGYLGNGSVGENWYIREYRGKTYLVRREKWEILMLDTKTWTLKAVVVGRPGNTVNSGSTYRGWIWTDGYSAYSPSNVSVANDGIPQGNPDAASSADWGEYRVWTPPQSNSAMKPAPPGSGATSMQNTSEWKFLQAINGFDYYHWGNTGTAIKAFKVQSWTPQGVPVYVGLPNYTTFAINTGGGIWDKPNSAISRAADGTLFLQGNYGADQGSLSQEKEKPRIKVYNPDGTLRAEIGRKYANKPCTTCNSQYIQPPPGDSWTYADVVAGSPINGVHIATDFNGGYDGIYPAITYTVHTSGIPLDDLFSNYDTKGGTLTVKDYVQNSDNDLGQVIRDPKTGQVLYFGAGESHGKVHRIWGWNGWIFKRLEFN